ncbi:MAG: TetR/AcrR family transcriptional regulator [Armatimonadetes bacterium]|nr:TetR/AcrR family transcriptional regulator [Armatimonadota bacterium]
MGRQSDAKQRILDSALNLMGERGYTDVGVEAIMQAAKVGKGSFYHFFKSKEVLGEAVMEEYSRRFEQEVVNEAFSPAYDPLEHPLRLITVITAQLQKQDPVLGCLAANCCAEGAGVPEEMRKKAAETLELVERKLSASFRLAVAEMDLLPDTPIEELAGACLAYVHGLFLLSKAKRSPDPMTRLGPLITHIWKPYLA